MHDLRVTLVQADQVWENKEENIRRYGELLTDVETDLIVLPEMFHTGFTMNAELLAEDFDRSPGIHFLMGLACSKNAAVYTSLIIRENGNFRNRGVFVRPDGQVSFYDKRKSFGLGGEDKVFKAGAESVIIDYNGWKINLQICYDLRFPELVRNGVGTDGKPFHDLILYVANWPQRRSSHWKTLIMARAIENQSYVVAVNRVGTDGNELFYSGDSCLADALGTVHFLQEFKEEVKTFQLNKIELDQTRAALPFLKDA